MSRAIERVVVLLVTLFCFGAGAEAQQGNTPQTTAATVAKDFEVIAVDGNVLTVRLPEGTRQMTVPDDFRFNVDGRQMSVRELKAGMKGTANITTRTTTVPVTVTEVRNGEVVVANAGNIIVRTADGVRTFTPTDAANRGITIMRDGQPVEMRELRAGDRLSATIVSQRPPRVITEREVQATLARAAAPAAAAPAAPAPAPQAAAQAPAPAPAPTATSGTQAPEPAAPRTLPSTASPIPLIGLGGLMSLSAGILLTATRRRRPR